MQHTPDPEPTIYELLPFHLGIWGAVAICARNLLKLSQSMVRNGWSDLKRIDPKNLKSHKKTQNGNIQGGPMSPVISRVGTPFIGVTSPHLLIYKAGHIYMTSFITAFQGAQDLVEHRKKRNSDANKKSTISVVTSEVLKCRRGGPCYL